MINQRRKEERRRVSIKGVSQEPKNLRMTRKNTETDRKRRKNQEKNRKIDVIFTMLCLKEYFN